MNLDKSKNLCLPVLALTLVTLSLSTPCLAQPLESIKQNLNVSETSLASSCLAGQASKYEEWALEQSGAKTDFVKLGFYEKETRLPSSGSKTTAVTDLLFEDDPYLLFRRFYDSKNRDDLGLGSGWTFLFNDKISVGFDRATLYSGLGVKIQFAGENHFLDSKTVTMKFTSLDKDEPEIRTFMFENPGKLTERVGSCEKTYLKFGEDFFLVNSKRFQGGEVKIARYNDGRIARITSGHHFIDLNWSASPVERLLSISDDLGRRIEF